MLLRVTSNQLKSVISYSVVPNFTILLCTKEQLNILKTEKSKGPQRLYLDASGEITRSVGKSKLLHHALVLPVMKDGQKEACLIPIAEMITDDNTSRNISFMLKTVSTMEIN